MRIISRLSPVAILVALACSDGALPPEPTVARAPDRLSRLAAADLEYEARLVGPAFAGGSGASDVNDAGAFLILYKAVDVRSPELGILMQPDGSLIYLQAPDGGTTNAIRLNDRGDVLLWSSSGPARSAWIRRSDGSFERITVPRGSPLVQALNNRGDVAGAFALPSGHTVFFRDSAGAFTEIMNGWNVFVAAMNDSRTMVGRFRPSLTSNSEPFMWSPETGLNLMGKLGTDQAAFTSVNEAGIATGYTQTAGDPLSPHGFVRAVDGTIRYLPGEMSTLPWDINDDGVMAGLVDSPTTPILPVIWTADLTPRQLPLPDGGIAAQAVSINSAGVVTGRAWLAGGSTRAIVWYPITDPSALIRRIQARLQDLDRAGTLSHGEATKVSAILANALQHVSAGRRDQAKHAAELAGERVEDLAGKGAISADTHAELSAAIARVVMLLQS